MTKDTNSTHYVDNARFLAEIKKYKEELKNYPGPPAKKPRIPEYCGFAIMQIATNLATKPSYSGYSFKEDMIGDAILNCVHYFDGFDPEQTNNPFAYFTTAIRRMFWQRISDEKKKLYTLYKHFDETMVQYALDGIDTPDGLISQPMYDNINDYIDDYEKSEEKRKQKKLEKKLQNGKAKKE